MNKVAQQTFISEVTEFDKVEAFSIQIDNLFAMGNYESAIEEIKISLKSDANNHWLLSKLSSAYYESMDYKNALLVSEKALKIKSDCPLVLWDYAGALNMSGRNSEALHFYKKIIILSKKVKEFGECWENKKWSESLRNDSNFRIGLIYEENGRQKMAKRYFLKHLDGRINKITSIYPLKLIKEKLK